MFHTENQRRCETKFELKKKKELNLLAVDGELFKISHRFMGQLVIWVRYSPICAQVVASLRQWESIMAKRGEPLLWKQHEI